MTISVGYKRALLRGGLVVGRWTCNLHVAGLIPSRWLSLT